MPNPAPGEGLSFLDVPGEPLTLRDTLQGARPPRFVGDDLTAKYGAEFPVLNKILDPHYPIVFHFHARDEDVWNHPEHFARHRWGKEEAYYFLPRPKGPGSLYPPRAFPGGYERDDLARAVARRRGTCARTLSGRAGKYLSRECTCRRGVPHRPGTALTLEIQQPSDVSLHLDWEFMGAAKDARADASGLPRAWRNRCNLSI